MTSAGNHAGKKNQKTKAITMRKTLTAEQSEARDAKRAAFRKFAVRSSVVRRFGADKPVTQVTVIPAVEAADKSSSSDEVTLQPGQWLEIVRHGAPDRWSKAVIRA